MPRNARIDVAGEIYHVINRANARLQIFNTDKDYQLFETALEEAKKRTDIKIYSYCLMPNHWHIILSPKEDGDLSKFVGWLTMTHTQRWHAIHNSIGTGHLYQGRYKSFLVQSSEYFLQACRYVERNPVRANLVRKSINWKWGSFWRRGNGTKEQRKMLNVWPVDMPKNYSEWVDEVESKEQLDTLRYSVNKGKPYGKISWVEKTIEVFKLNSTLRNPGRPKKGS
jgi:putative transposase